MKFKIPTLDEVSERIRKGFNSEIEGADAHIWPNNLYVVAKVVATAIYELFLRLQWIGEQAFVLTASSSYLDRHGSEYGMARLPATYATGVIRITGAVAGLNFNAGDIFTRSDGTQYEVLESIQIPTIGDVDISVRAVEFGTGSNTIAGASFNSVDTIIPAEAVVQSDVNGITGGTEIESDENYRRRLLQRKRFTPHLGAPSDFKRWGFEVSGVSRVFVQRATPAPGQVTVLFMMDEVYPNALPQSGDIERLRDHLLVQGPASADIIVDVPTLRPINITATNIQPLNQSVINAINAEIAEVFKQRSQLGQNFSKSWIAQAISNATNEESHLLVAPATNVNIADGELPVIGVVNLS